ncbi:MAG: hypothetical protein K0U98_13095 [Deltaproteobacteria bacterium]|nr:hypothetical protein [Deltaproteobacteria bacterium]
MAEEYRIKGSSIRGKLDYIRESFGEDAEFEVKELLSNLGVVLILESDWYDHRIYENLNQFLAQRFFKGDISKLVDVGIFSANRALSSTYRAYLERGDFVRFLQRLASLHSRFFSHGDMEVLTAPDEKSCQIHLSGAPSYPKADMQIAVGFYIGAGHAFGLEKIEHQVQHRFGGVRFLLQWQDHRVP